MQNSKKWRPFEEAREFVRSLGLKNSDEWKIYCKSGEKPDDIPANPQPVYKDRWKGYGDWLGTGAISSHDKTFLTFKEAREFIHSLGLKSYSEWEAYCKSGEKPDDIPANPYNFYKEDWKGYNDWLGTGKALSKYKIEWRPFEEAREFVRSLGLKNNGEWRTYAKSKDRSYDIPSSPDKIYKDEWKGYGDWLGTGTVLKKVFRPFEEAREYVRSLKFKRYEDWNEYRKSENRPNDIPSLPEQVYKDEWKGYGDWLGTGTVATQDRTYLPFEEAKKYVRGLGLKDQKEWISLCKSKKKPDDIPASPWAIYKKEWRGLGDWLGIVTCWKKPALLALLEDLRSHIGVLDESEIYMLLQKSGALPTLCLAARTKSVQSVLKDIKENDGKRIEAGLKGVTEEELEVVQDGSDESSCEVVSDEKEVSQTDTEKIFGDLSKRVTPQALRSIDEMRPPAFMLDEEMAEYLISNRVNALWECHINGENEVVAMALKGNGGHYFNEIKRRFVAEIKAVKTLPIPDGWDFTDNFGKYCQPNLMQRWTAWQIQGKQRVGNWSGVGSGKTLSAVLASRVIDARVTVIIANSAVIEEAAGNGWQKQILNAYPDSAIHLHEHIKEGLIFDRERHHYVLLNYEKFQREGDNRDDLMETLLSFSPDFIVLDEIHFVKQRDEKASKRREALEYLIRQATEVNPSLHVLGMSATPVINNLQEAKKLLEMVTGEGLSDVGTVPTINNALTLHRQLMLNGLRYRPRYEQEMPPIIISETHNEILEDLQEAQRSVLTTEQVLLPTKLEIARSHFTKGTLVYTHYVEEMVEPTRRYLEGIGLTVGLYTGSDKSGLSPFLRGEVDILLGSAPVGTGLDGLQRVCNRLVMLSLPWTSAGYEQVIGRLRRQGQTKQVEVIIPQVSLERDGEAWSWDELRLDCIEYKRTLSDCVLDGKIPDTISVNQKEFLRQSREMLEQWIELSFGKLAMSA